VVVKGNTYLTDRKPLCWTVLVRILLELRCNKGTVCDHVTLTIHTYTMRLIQCTPQSFHHHDWGTYILNYSILRYWFFIVHIVKVHIIQSFHHHDWVHIVKFNRLWAPSVELETRIQSHPYKILSLSPTLTIQLHKGCVTVGTDSCSMHTWYVGQARLFSLTVI
jgi:hypothetical protein